MIRLPSYADPLYLQGAADAFSLLHRSHTGSSSPSAGTDSRPIKFQIPCRHCRHILFRLRPSSRLICMLFRHLAFRHRPGMAETQRIKCIIAVIICKRIRRHQVDSGPETPVQTGRLSASGFLQPLPQESEAVLSDLVFLLLFSFFFLYFSFSKNDAFRIPAHTWRISISLLLKSPDSAGIRSPALIRVLP